MFKKAYFKNGKRIKEINKSAPAKQLVNGVLGLLGFNPDMYAIFEICDQETNKIVPGCETVALQGKRVCIQVPSVVHRQELIYSKKRIIKRINDALGRMVIRDIHFELKS